MAGPRPNNRRNLLPVFGQGQHPEAHSFQVLWKPAGGFSGQRTKPVQAVGRVVPQSNLRACRDPLAAASVLVSRGPNKYNDNYLKTEFHKPVLSPSPALKMHSAEGSGFVETLDERRLALGTPAPIDNNQGLDLSRRTTNSPSRGHRAGDFSIIGVGGFGVDKHTW